MFSKKKILKNIADDKKHAKITHWTKNFPFAATLEKNILYAPTPACFYL